jgi:hypothetical protein
MITSCGVFTIARSDLNSKETVGAYSSVKFLHVSRYTSRQRERFVMAMLARRSARIHAALAISPLFPDSKDPLAITHLVYNPADLSAGAHRDPGNREDKF